MAAVGPPNIVAVLVAEFDIERGSVVRAQYPAPLDAAEDALAELMLPEGAHNHEADWTIFAVRPMLSRAHAPDVAVRVDAYVFGGDAWVPHCADEQLALSLEVGHGGSRALVLRCCGAAAGARSGGAERLRVRLHAELQYTVLQEGFVSCYAEDGTALGFHFRAAEQQAAFSERLDAAIPESDDGAELPASGADAAGAAGSAAAPPGGSALAQMVDARAEASDSASASPTPDGRPPTQPPPLVWVLNLVCTRKDRRIRRGAEVKAIAVATTDQHLHAYKVRPARARAAPPRPPRHTRAYECARRRPRRPCARHLLPRPRQPVLVQAMQRLLADSAAALAADDARAATGAAGALPAATPRRPPGDAGGAPAARAIAAKVYECLMTIDLAALGTVRAAALAHAHASTRLLLRQLLSRAARL